MGSKHPFKEFRLSQILITITRIKTELWNDIIKCLRSKNWTLEYEYDNFDKGIDSDFYIFRKDEDEILIGWDNWFEGEVKCSERNLAIFKEIIGNDYESGDPVNLKPEVIDLHRKWHVDKRIK
ncbi:MAG: hypothetical protein MRY83_18545 [Flavobacteriales bacterium]|nr:hypothetical protein [Flavobacteriales bacterium]